MSTIWRIAAGDKEKDLIGTMLGNGVMMVGHGKTGDISGLELPVIQDLLTAKCDVEQSKSKATARLLLRFRDGANIGASQVSG